MSSHPLFVSLALFLLSGLLSFAVWLVKELRSAQAAVAEWSATAAELRAILVGPDGQDGVRADVRRLCEARDRQGELLHAHAGRLALHDERHRRHDARLEELETARERRYLRA
jgi:hypothetical protein